MHRFRRRRGSRKVSHDKENDQAEPAEEADDSQSPCEGIELRLKSDNTASSRLYGAGLLLVASRSVHRVICVPVRKPDLRVSTDLLSGTCRRGERDSGASSTPKGCKTAQGLATLRTGDSVLATLGRDRPGRSDAKIPLGGTDLSLG